MRAIWTGAIGFGLVNIPIRIFSATTDSRPDFDMLDRKDHSRIRYKRVSEKTGKEVAWDQIVKGYMLNDNYIVLDDADFEEASPEKTKIINLKSFVKEADIDSIYFESPYYLQAQKGGEKAYVLLLNALEKTKMAGLSTFVMRNTESLAVIRPHQGILLLNTLRFEEEIRSVDEIKPGQRIKIAKPEMDMAVQLIKRYSSDFDITSYRDEYSKELMKIIRAKAKGKRPTVRKMKPRKAPSEDLLEQLKASLA
ncbi:non-homologous end joining protein Ku [Parapedobacter defluvii]|uniref:Non-homologous end joining protein Ku n=1 Tax=Parapedobacter defluvii TaxID=2045106 RepID=A0ABQ1MSM9_9SPHI|nr:Ku protein [Parapedobacter defluvii]RQP19266.1 MAG: Ku protein [Parapedobacter sp.]GGC43599.1 non-homologous end joining protein Ku [Parapedobacter defluvii]